MPEITESELKKQIDSTRLERLYLLFGDESYFVSKHAERLIAKAAGENFAAFNLQKFQGTECPADRVADAVATLPFMAEQKCVAVSDWNPEALTSDELEKWKKLLAEIPETTVLVLYCPSVRVDRKKSAKWKSFLSLISKYGAIVECKKRDAAEAEKLLCAYAAKQNCSISRQDAGRLIQLCGNQLQTLFHEMEKLCAYVGAGEITRKTIDEVAVPNAETTVFLLAKALVSGESDRAYALLDILLRQNEKPVAILSVLSSSYLDMYRVKAALESGGAPELPAKAFDYRGKEFRLRAAEREIKGVSMETLRKSLALLLETDIALKSSVADGRLLLEMLFARLFMLRSA